MYDMPYLRLGFTCSDSLIRDPYESLHCETIKAGEYLLCDCFLCVMCEPYNHCCGASTCSAPKYGPKLIMAYVVFAHIGCELCWAHAHSELSKTIALRLLMFNS